MHRLRGLRLGLRAAYRPTLGRPARLPMRCSGAKKESALSEWQTAIEVLILCNRGGDSLIAMIGVMKALRDRPPPN